MLGAEAPHRAIGVREPAARLDAHITLSSRSAVLTDSAIGVSDACPAVPSGVPQHCGVWVVVPVTQV